MPVVPLLPAVRLVLGLRLVEVDRLVVDVAAGLADDLAAGLADDLAPGLADGERSSGGSAVASPESRVVRASAARALPAAV
ncbi:MAG: hypothetical protein M3253_04800 [Chloroflexota bacterium]|nr:hypothetical protein [Chloroflexota bacterium]